MLMRGIVAVSIVAAGMRATCRVSAIACKIVRHIMAHVEAMLTAQAHQRQHELAD